MDLHDDLADWCRKMGYSGTIPNDLTPICSQVTRHIWEQLMQNARPKKEVEYIRKNILLHRLKVKEAASKAKNTFYDEIPLKELELLKERQDLEERVKYLKRSVLEKSCEFEELAQTRKSTEAALDAQKVRIKSFEHRNFLLEKKQEELKVQLLQAKEMLAQQTPKNISTNKNVKDVLKECAVKLENIISESHQDSKRGATSKVWTVNASLVSANCSGTIQETNKTLKVSEKLKEKIYLYATNIEKTLDEFHPEKVNQELQKYIKNSIPELNQLASDEEEERLPKLTEVDVANLRFAHVKKEMEILRQNKIIKELETKINEMKAVVLGRFEELPNSDHLTDCLEKKLQQVTLNATSVAMKKIVTSVIVESQTESDSLSAEILKVKDDIIGQKVLIQWTIDEMERCYKEILIKQESARNTIYDICSLITYTDWMDILREGLCYKEMQIFNTFPLNCQRNFGESSFFHQTDISKRDRKLLLEIFGTSTTPSEKVLFNIWKMKFLLEQFQLLRKKQLNNPLFEDVSEKYSLQSLNNEETRTVAIAERLRLLLDRCPWSKTLALTEKVKRSFNLWIQLPDVIVISSKRTWKGHNFEFYQRQLNRYA